MPRKPKIGPPTIFERIREHNTINGDSFETIDEWFEHGLRGIKFRQELLEYLRQGYTETKNPLYPWDARSLAQRWQLPVPEWVKEYLDRANRELLNPENKIKDIAKVFGFDGNAGSASLFKQYQRQRALDEAVAVTNAILRNRSVTLEEAIKEAEQVGVKYGVDLSPSENGNSPIDKHRKKRMNIL